MTRLNVEIAKDPDYILPNGFRKIQHQEIVYDYRVPGMLEINETKKIAFEVLDSFMADTFGIHILEPVARYGTHDSTSA